VTVFDEHEEIKRQKDRGDRLEGELANAQKNVRSVTELMLDAEKRKREQFASMAMQGLSANASVTQAAGDHARVSGTDPGDVIAAMAVAQADSLLAALESIPTTRRAAAPDAAEAPGSVQPMQGESDL
jgi:cell division septum initiation protein DivIVA